MHDSVRAPGGVLGALSAAAAYLLLAVGAAGVIVVLASLAGANDLWSDDASDSVTGLVFFLIVMSGAAGLALQPRQRVLGTVLASLGGLALAVILFWALAPLVIGPAIVILAAVRARRLGSSTAGMPRVGGGAPSV